MKTLVAVCGLCLAAAPAFAVKPCEELKTEIAAKLDAKGVKGYTLDIVALADAKDKTVVGSCDGGTKNITYTKGAAAEKAPEPKGK
jgi:hypothetical protein